MICKVCGSEFDSELFDVCPFCLTPVTEEKKLVEQTQESLENENKEAIFVEESSTESKENIVEVVAPSNKKEDEVPTVTPKKVSNGIPHIVLQQIDGLSVRAKNVFSKNNIVTFKDLMTFLKNNKISDLKGAGANVEEEVSNIISTVLCGEFSSGEMPDQFKRKEDLVIDAITKDELQNIDIYKIPDISHRTHNVCCRNKAFDMLAVAYLVKKNKKIKGGGANFIKEISIIFDNFLRGEYAALLIEESKTSILEKALIEVSGKREFDIFLRRTNGETLQEIGDNPTNLDDGKLTRERVRQIEANFNRKYRQMAKDMVNEVFEGRIRFDAQEIRDIYSNEDFGTVLIAILKDVPDFTYLDFADLFVRTEKYSDVKNKISSIVRDFVGDGINLYENVDEIDDLFRSSGIDFMGLEELISYLQDSGYRFYGDYVTNGRVSYAKLCLKIIKESFPQGIKLNQDNDNPCEELQVLRNLAKERFGDIGIPDQDRALSARLGSYLVISDRGRATVPENVQIDLSLMNEIKDYIDDYRTEKLYYSEIFASFKGVLQMTSNVNNQYFLHGALMLHFPDEYDYYRDYLIKKDANNHVQSIEDRIRQFICEMGRPVSRKELWAKFPGFTDIMINLRLDESQYLVQSEYSYYTSMDLYSYDSSDVSRLSKIISQSLESHRGFSSENLLFEGACAEMKEFLERNNFTSPVRLFYFCEKLLKDKYMFRHPNIGKYGMVDCLSMKDIVFHLAGDKEKLSYKDFSKIGNGLKWSETSISNVFLKIIDEYYRVDEDIFILKDRLDINPAIVNSVESILLKELTSKDYISLISYDDFSEYPDMDYEWNTFILESIIQKYLPELVVLSQDYKDKRFHRSFIVKKASQIGSYAELVAREFKKNGYTTLSAGKLLSFLVVNGLAYARIPKELETSGFFKVENEIYSLV